MVRGVRGGRHRRDRARPLRQQPDHAAALPVAARLVRCQPRGSPEHHIRAAEVHRCRRRRAEARSQELLTNAIPRSIAERLQHGEERIAESYPATTVLFADLAGFTPWAGRTDPARVVSFLDDLFTRFDDLAAAAGVEKIKTIGDEYMAVAGAPEPRSDHASAAIRLAGGMLSALDETCRRLDAALQLRIGLASGPVVGGVIGRRRILFDLWGDTVNTASRMQSSGIPARVHVAKSTRDLLRDDYVFEAREAVEVKGLGLMQTYLLAEPIP
jgi:class 3 adenylate cyclase